MQRLLVTYGPVYETGYKQVVCGLWSMSNPLGYKEETLRLKENANTVSGVEDTYRTSSFQLVP